MNIWRECALGAVLCLVWAFAQYQLHVRAEQNPTRFNTIVNFTSRVLLAAAITAIGFTFIGAVVETLMQAMFRQ